MAIKRAAGTVHVSFRLPKSLLASIDEIAERIGDSRARTAAGLLEEAVRATLHPGIVFRPGPAGRRAALVGGPDVWEVVSIWKENRRNARATADYLGLPLALVAAALDYYDSYREEIDSWIRRNEVEASRAEASWRRRQVRTR